MADMLEPPVRYPKDNGSKKSGGRLNRRQRKSTVENDSNIIKPEKSFKGLRKSDLFVTGSFDIPFFALTMVILAVGLVMLFSSSYAYSYYKYDNSYHYFFRQLIFAAIGIAFMFFLSKLNYRWFKALAPYFFGITVFLLVLVLFYHTNVSTDEGEAFKRYIKIPGLGITFQPSDIAKFTLIITLATYISKNAGKMNRVKEGFLFPGLIVALYCGLILLENHMSGTILVFVIGMAVMFAGGSNKKIFAVGVAIVVAGILIVLMFPDALPQYVQQKLVAWRDKDFEPLGARWQTNNSLYAIGSGGLFGVGLGNSKQKYLYVSEPQNDFIFSIVCEELGFIGAAVIIVLFALLVVRGIIIALRCEDKFASLTVIGIVTQIGVQVAFNILVVTDSIPNTGIALPFFSYGGTALVMILCEMGVVLGISRKSNQKKV